MKNIKFALVWIVGAVLLVSCSGGKQVTRLDPTMVTDLSGKWNDTDSRLVAEEMIADALSRPWLTKFKTQHNREPVVIVGNVYNKTREHISEDTFIKDLERAFINSGLVEMVQSGAMRDDIRKERADQQEFASEETRARWKQETGADFMLSGTINAIEDASGNRKVMFYQVDLELTNMETNQKVWIGNKKIKKLID
ncbi:MAG: penicillin-binding protein activator LpoB [Gemmatimonadetes bacterium]|nr:MAG: penicillin-binding protein activator LpoB [Gemmatimonadota bacterium]